MKFRYFLRGLGVGIIFTSILFMAAYQENATNNKITDAEIIKRAKALGMVEVNSRIGSILSSEQDLIDEQGETDSDSENAADASDESEEQDLQEEETTQATEEQGDLVGQSEEDDTSQQNTVAITIERGDSSFPICQRLQELGMIPDASEFDTYMVDNGYARRIRVGTHQLTRGMSFHDIAEAISDPL